MALGEINSFNKNQKGGFSMWIYEKKLEYPVKIVNPNPRMAKYIITQYGGPDGELNLLHVQNPLFIRVLELIVYIYFSFISYHYPINQFS